MSEKPHSADYFGDSRDFWWNRDFLELMSRRWNLSTVKAVLDVGCGVGHWSRCLAPHLPAGCALTGVDREARWIEEARRRSAELRSISTSFQQGEAERLPFPDEAFDFVTCQTVLIHQRDPLAVLREMARVLVPGGLLVAVEPNNLATNTRVADPQKPVSEILRALEFQMICERGKMNLGEGFNSAGPLVAGWLARLGLQRIESFLADKTMMLVPPYSTTHEQAVIREMRDRDGREFWCWDREDTKRYFAAGGGDVGSFDARWNEVLAEDRGLLHAIDRADLSITYAPVCLIVSGRKPGKTTVG